MKKVVSILLVIAMATALVACGSAAPQSSAPAAEPAAPAAAPAPAAEEKNANTVDVGIVFPTKDEPRWTQDEAKFMAALSDYGFSAELLYSQGDSATELKNVEALISKGIKVLILSCVDGAAAVASMQTAKEAGVTTIAYDRMINDTDAVDYCVMYDNLAIGEAQAQYLVDHASGSGNSLYLSTGAASDDNAILYFRGYWNVLQPKVADGTFKIVNSSEAVTLQDKSELSRDELLKIVAQVTQNWNANDARNKAEAFLSAASDADKGDMFVINPNGGASRVIYDTLIADPAVTSVTITGQDAEPASIQYVIDGKQTMDILKDTNAMVKAALKMANSIVKGEAVETNGTINNNAKDIPTAYADFVIVDQSNIVKEVFDSGFYNKDDYDWSNFAG